MTLSTRATVTVLATVALLAGACGDGGGTRATATTSTTSTTEATTSTTVLQEITTVPPATAASVTTTTAKATAKATTTTTKAVPTTVKATTTTKRATTTTAAAPAGDVSAAQVRLTQVTSADSPISLVWRPGGQAYVAEKGGRIRLLRGSALDPAPVLDISSQVSDGGEQGLLDITFSPKGDFLYVFYTDNDGNERLDEYPFSGDRALGARRNVLTVNDPASNHNGGRIVFGPDGYLWWSLGDGGGANNQYRNAQNANAFLGKVLRIDPRPSGGAPYRSAPDNPHAGGRGGGRPEIAVTGLRNPWRYSFDRATGDLWIGDVGQNKYEEVDRLRAGGILGANMGWSYREGAHPFESTPPPAGLVDPVYDYGRDGGAAVCGGYVYRGAAIPALRGIYVYADTYTAKLQLLSVGAGGTRHRDTGVPVPGGIVSSFAEGPGGELYVLSLQGGGIYRIDRA